MNVCQVSTLSGLMPNTIVSSTVNLDIVTFAFASFVYFAIDVPKATIRVMLFNKIPVSSESCGWITRSTIDMKQIALTSM